MTDFLSDRESDCAGGPTETVTVDGVNGSLCGTEVALSVANRGYFIRLYTSGDEPWLAATYDSGWFKNLLKTVKLHPKDAVTPASPSASTSS